MAQETIQRAHPALLEPNSHVFRREAIPSQVSTKPATSTAIALPKTRGTQLRPPREPSDIHPSHSKLSKNSRTIPGATDSLQAEIGGISRWANWQTRKT